MESFLEPSSGGISKEPLVINFHGKFLQFKEPFPGGPGFQMQTVSFRECKFFTSPKMDKSPLKRNHFRRKIFSQPSIFRGHVSFYDSSFLGLISFKLIRSNTLEISYTGTYYCWWFRNPKQPPGMVLRPRNEWDKLPTSTGAGFLPSTVVWFYFKKNRISFLSGIHPETKQKTQNNDLYWKTSMISLGNL